MELCWETSHYSRLPWVVWHRSIILDMSQFYRLKGYFMFFRWRHTGEKLKPAAVRKWRWRFACKSLAAGTESPNSTKQWVIPTETATGVKERTDAGLRAKCGRYLWIYSDGTFLFSIIKFVASQNQCPQVLVSHRYCNAFALNAPFRYMHLICVCVYMYV